MTTMTLERLRDWHRQVQQEWSDADLQERMRLVIEFPHGAAATFLDAHLAQPAQAVDVGADFGAMNSALCAFAMRWEIDGDYMRCLKCKRPQITNYASHDFPHAHDCKAAGKVEARPWETFAQLLSPLTRALSGEKAGPVGEVTFDMVRIAEHLCPTDLPHLDKLRWKARKLTELLPASPTPDKEWEG